jgi:tRNA G26 N,N-dimethylase Trm1
MHRYVKEIPGVKRVVVNDLEEAAVEAAKNNMLVCFDTIQHSINSVTSNTALLCYNYMHAYTASVVHTIIGHCAELSLQCL